MWKVELVTQRKEWIEHKDGTRQRHVVGAKVDSLPGAAAPRAGVSVPQGIPYAPVPAVGDRGVDQVEALHASLTGGAGVQETNSTPEVTCKDCGETWPEAEMARGEDGLCRDCEFDRQEREEAYWYAQYAASRRGAVPVAAEDAEDDFGYDLDDPKHPTWAERMFDQVDDGPDLDF
jgi:hypothetical protein